MIIIKDQKCSNGMGTGVTSPLPTASPPRHRASKHNSDTLHIYHTVMLSPR